MRGITHDIAEPTSAGKIYNYILISGARPIDSVDCPRAVVHPHALCRTNVARARTLAGSSSFDCDNMPFLEQYLVRVMLNLNVM